MIEILTLTFLTVLIIFGVHAVTRSDKLLSFLGVRIKDEEELNKLESMINVDRIDLQEDFFASLSQTIDVPKKLALIEKYKLAHERLNNYHERYHELKAKIQSKKRNIFWKIISPFAPMLTECLTCMSSFWSAATFTTYFFISDTQLNFAFIILLPFCVAGLIEIICRIAQNEWRKLISSIENIEL